MQSNQPGYTGFNVSFTATRRGDGAMDVSYPTISDVIPETPAAGAGLASGDVILQVNGIDARNSGALFPRAGVQYAMRIRRGNEESEIVLVPAIKQTRW